MNAWANVTRSEPCTICGKDSWCSRTADGAVICRRVSDGALCTRADSSGSPYHIHTHATATANPVPSASRATRAADDVLHRVHSRLLARLQLSASHRGDLQRRGLTDHEIDAREYRTLPKGGRSSIAKDLYGLFGDPILTVPGFATRNRDGGSPYPTIVGAAGLLVPVRNTTGEIVAIKIRRSEGHGAKYVYLSSTNDDGPGPGAPVHVPLHESAATDSVRVTEGELKADVATSISGMLTVSAPGVSNWWPVLETLRRLDISSVRLAFDADADTNPTVGSQLGRCAYAMREAGFEVAIETWAPESGKGIDDVLAGGGEVSVLEGDDCWSWVETIAPGETPIRQRVVRALERGGAIAFYGDKGLHRDLAQLHVDDPAEHAAVTEILRQSKVKGIDKVLRPIVNEIKKEKANRRSHEGQDEGPYRVENGAICRLKPTRDGEIIEPLCNFTARITEESSRDDGVESTTVFVIEGQSRDGQGFPDAEVPAAEYATMSWVVGAWGHRAIIYAGMGAKDHLRAAIQTLSSDARRRTVYTHLGWRQVDGEWVYLHAGGAIGTEKPITVDPPEKLQHYQLNPLPDLEIREAVRASLGLLELAPDRITCPILAATYRAPLGAVDTGVHIEGETGAYKSELAALALQHFGRNLTARNFPENWSSTANAIEATAFYAKDTLLVVDDFIPQGPARDASRLHATADRVFRGLGNSSGRGRMRADLSLHASRPPRCLILSTGEETPRGHSLRARLIVVSMDKGCVDVGLLTKNQQLARDGVFEHAMAAYIAWLATRLDGIRASLRDRVSALRDKWRQRLAHARTPEAAANLMVGAQIFLEFAFEIGAIDEHRRRALEDRFEQAILEVALEQDQHHRENEPAAQFIRLVAAALASGQAHLADTDGGRPAARATSWGWPSDSGARPSGKKIGWVRDPDIFLQPDAAFAAAQELARNQGESVPTSPQRLRRRLKEQGLLASIDDARGRLTVRRVLEDLRRDVLHVEISVLLGETVPTVPFVPRLDGVGRSHDDAGQSPAESSHHNHLPDSHLHQMGQLGRFSARGNDSLDSGDDRGDGTVPSPADSVPRTVPIRPTTPSPLPPHPDGDLGP